MSSSQDKPSYRDKLLAGARGSNQPAPRPYTGTGPDQLQPSLLGPFTHNRPATPVVTGGPAVHSLTDRAVQPAAIPLPHRPGEGTRGDKMVVKTNHFLVHFSGKKLQHYKVKINPQVTSNEMKRAVMKTLVEEYQSQLGGLLPVFDGTSVYVAGEFPFESETFNVPYSDAWRERNFIVEFNRIPKDPTGVQVIHILHTALREHLSNSKNVVPVGRSFYSDLYGVNKVGNGLDVWKGFYQSLRQTQMGLSLNLCVVSTTFIEPLTVIEYVSKCLGKDLCRNSTLTQADIGKIKINLKGVQVVVQYQDKVQRKYRISDLTTNAARELTFACGESGLERRVDEYYRDVHNLVMKFTNLPCLVFRNSRRKVNYLPMEVCEIVKGQRSRNFGLANLARGQNPEDHQRSIMNVFGRNNYENDKYAIEFGLTIEKQPTLVQAHVLPPPRLKYYNRKMEKESCMPNLGFWDMKNKKLVNGGAVNYWYCLSFAPCVRQNDAKRFCNQVASRCRTCGMVFANNPIFEPVLAEIKDLETTLKSCFRRASSILSHLNKLPDLVIVILPDNNGNAYGDLKRICETDIGLVTQCCLSSNVSKPRASYLQGVALKINIKVGGRNTVLDDEISRKVPVVSKLPTIIFGADVTHPSGEDNISSSIAAVVASQDWPEITTYAGTFKAQGPNEEIIIHLKEMVKEHLLSFRTKNKFLPEQIIFYRDGVGESQFQQVLRLEIAAIKSACEQLEEHYKPTITFIVVQKRHHTRLFPNNKNEANPTGNVLPGTVVDTKICHPIDFDFYLCSHSGRLGTSRPAHYYVLLDDHKFCVDELQALTYNLCYTYVKCTQAVSIVPPIHYAHQVAYRARKYLEPSALSSIASDEVRPLKENLKDVMFFC